MIVSKAARLTLVVLMTTWSPHRLITEAAPGAVQGDSLTTLWTDYQVSVDVLMEEVGSVTL